MGGPGGGQGTITMHLSNAGDLNENWFYFGVFYEGATPGIDDAYAGGSDMIANGAAEATAMLMDGSDVWYGNIGESYDIYMMVDIDGDGNFNPWADFSYEPTPYTITLDSSEMFESVDRSSFVGPSPHPAVFGVYSESHEVFVEPDWSPTQDVNLEFMNTNVAPLDGMYVLYADFFADISWIKARYPDNPSIMNINASSNLVFSIDTSDGSMADLTSFEVILESAFSGTPGVNGMDAAYYDSTNGNWDTYIIPIGDLISAPDPDFDPSELIQINIGNPRNSLGNPIHGLLYFDDIHFN
jgi:hypothetical protein